MPPIDSATHHTEALVFFTLLQLTVIIVAARLAGALALRMGQAAVVGEILVGILLGPSLLGWLAPVPFHYVFHSIDGAPLQVLAQLGLVLLMFQIGLSFEFGHLVQKKHRRAVLAIALASLVLPFALGFGMGQLSAPLLSPQAHPLASALFVATALSITALPILGRIMLEFGLTRTPLGVITISAAAINDVVGWLLLMLVSMIALSAFDPGQFALHIVGVLAFFLLAWFVARPVLIGLIHRFDHGGTTLSAHTLGLVLAAIFLAAMTTFSLGIFAIFGGFLTGVLLHRERRFATAWDQQVTPFITVFFLPIFFTYTGLRTDIGSLNSLDSWLWCGGIVAAATVGKFGGAYLAARWTGHSAAESKIIGIMMNTRALMELIIINVGYDLGAISREVFTMLVIMAVFSTVLTTPLMRRWLPATRLADPPAKVVPRGGTRSPEKLPKD